MVLFVVTRRATHAPMPLKQPLSAPALRVWLGRCFRSDSIGSRTHCVSTWLSQVGDWMCQTFSCESESSKDQYMTSMAGIPINIGLDRIGFS
ncbi:hypothetical protein BDV34DRAFT_202110 [Aspergillus parasiticus]|uniref:Uncharacterized protein n=1 Tax=Aspergillus parasiticus TaxID=5067 RepID=A0A5N6D987_ASPPA|nr:hypothetical protein BDV34DRAFT_202110 [Aspergillus parasiticus]